MKVILILPALGCKLPRNLHYFARDSLFIGPLGILIRNLNSIPVNRSRLDLITLKRVLNVLDKGNHYWFFRKELVQLMENWEMERKELVYYWQNLKSRLCLQELLVRDKFLERECFS